MLVKWIMEMGELGFPITKSQLLESVSKLMKNLRTAFVAKNGIMDFLLAILKYLEEFHKNYQIAERLRNTRENQI